jgi:hypothetical protein
MTATRDVSSGICSANPISRICPVQCGSYAKRVRKVAQVFRNNNTPRFCKGFLGKATSEKTSGGGARSARGLGVVRRVTDHDGLSGGNLEFSNRETD